MSVQVEGATSAAGGPVPGPGRSLGYLSAKLGPMPAARAVLILRRILEALRSAHERGLAHGKVNAGNVLVAAQGEVKLVDFVPGLRASPQAIARDLHGAALLFAAMLSGQGTVQLERSVPPALRTVVQRALHADPAKRYPSAAEFLQDLQATDELTAGMDAGEHVWLTETRKTQAAPQPPAQRVRRTLWLAIAGLAMFLATVGAMVFSSRVASPLPSGEDPLAAAPLPLIELQSRATNRP